jgi:hypothetical protein
MQTHVPLPRKRSDEPEHVDVLVIGAGQAGRESVVH